MNRGISRDIQAHVRYGEIGVAMVAEGVSWSPDAANDLVNRVSVLWENTLQALYSYGMLDTDTDDEEDEYGPTPEKELIDPRRVFLEGDNG